MRAIASLSCQRTDSTPGRMLARAWLRSSPPTTRRDSRGLRGSARYSVRVATRTRGPSAIASSSATSAMSEGSGAAWSVPYIARKSAAYHCDCVASRAARRSGAAPLPKTSAALP